METGINHNIDELLVGIVTQIRLKQAGQEGDRRTRVDKVSNNYNNNNKGNNNKDNNNKDNNSNISKRGTGG